MKIRKLTIDNVGPYVHEEIEFSDGLTVIRGPNLSGKSWTWHAAYWCLTNEGMSFEQLQREQGKAVSVEIEFSNGAAVRRERTSSRNIYILRAADGGEQEIIAGRGPNEQVAEFIGVQPFQLAEKWRPLLQFQGEHDGVFLLSEPTGVQESALARVVGADVIEQATNNLHSSLTSIVRKLNATKEGLGELESDLEAYEGIDGANELIGSAERLRDAAEAERKALDDARSALNRLTEHQHEHSLLSSNLSQMPEMPSLLPLEQDQQAVSIAKQAVTRLQSAWADAQTLQPISSVSPPHVAELEDSAAMLVNAKAHADRLLMRSSLHARLGDVDATLSGVSETLGSLPSRIEETRRARAFLDMDARAAGVRAELLDVDAEIGGVVAEYQRVIVEAGVCPTCGQSTVELEVF